jgi:uracil-DNA glycosylase family 4
MVSAAFDPSHTQVRLLSLAKCGACSRCTETQEPNRPVHGVGPVNANLIVVGEAPGAAEVNTGRIFSGPSGRLLWDVLSELGIERHSVYATNALLCGTSADKSTVKGKDLQACKPRLEDDLQRLCEDPVTGEYSRVILCLGASAAESILGTKANLNKDNGRAYWHAGYHAWIVVTYNPAALLYSPNLYPDFTWALGRAKHYLNSPNGPKPAPRNAAYSVASTPQVYHEWVRQWTAPHGVCDIETTGLNVTTDDILDVVFTYGQWEALVFTAPWEPWKVQCLCELLENTKTTWIYHNGKFDVQFLREQLSVPARIDADTMLMHYLLDERAGGDDDGGVARISKGYHGLKQLSHKYLDMDDWSTGIDRAKLAEVEEQTRWQYAANDVCATLDLYWALRKELDEQPPSREGFPRLQVTHDRLLIPAANALADVERRGMLIDQAKMAELTENWQERIDQSERRLRNLAAPHLFSARKMINLGSTAQVAAVLYDGMGYRPTEGDKTKSKRSTNKRALHDMQRQDLEAERDPNDFIDMMLDYSSLLRTKAMYLDGMRQHIDPDGRVRSDLLLHGTVSGRLASLEPNLQNIPADSPLKEMFIPDDGYLMLEADYDQLEVRICAWYSRDPQLIADLQADDFHYTVAHWIFPDVVDSLEASRSSLGALEKLASRVVSFHDFDRRQRDPLTRTDDPEVLFGWLKKRIRRQTKFCTFGIIYGRGARALADPETGLGVSVEEAALYKDRWTQRYRWAMRWLSEQSRYANKYRWVESATGRRRRFPWQPDFLRSHIDNQASNMPIQSWASDVCLKSTTQLNYELPAAGLGDVLMTVHDSIICQVPIPRAEEARAYVKHVMEHQLLDEEIAFTAEVHLGESWGACRK